MKRLLENSCMKGCVVYAVALLIVLAVSAFGLSGLSAGLGGGGEAARSPGQQTASDQAAPSTGAVSNQSTEESSRITIQVGGPEQSASQPEPTAVPTQIQAPPQPEQQPAPPAQGGAPQQPNITGVGTAPQPQAQAHAPDISGETTSPFYIVQPGDSLFGIALKFETTVEALRAANNLPTGENLIYSGNVIYLPAATPPAPESQLPAPIPVEQQASPLQPSDSAVPTMPRTGINTTP